MDFIKSQEEYNIVTAISNSPQIGGGHQDTLEQLLDVVSEWRAFIGIPNNDISEELAIAANFIRLHFSILTINEIKLAYNLAIMRKLGDVEFRGFFSPDYIARVLNSYMHYRKITLADSTRRLQSYNTDVEAAKNAPPPEKQAENMRVIIKDFHNQFVEKGEFNDPLNIAYHYFTKHKVLIVTKNLSDAAITYARKVVADKNQNKFIANSETGVKIIARNYCVQELFKNVDIDVLINNIKSENFIS